MSKTKKPTLIGFIALALLALVIVAHPFVTFGKDVDTSGTDSSETSVPDQGLFRTYTFYATSTGQTFFATSSSATSTNIEAYFDSSGIKRTGQFIVAGAKRVSMWFGRGDVTGTGNTGTSTFKVQVTPDGTNWFDFSRFITSTSSDQSTKQSDVLWQPFIDLIGTSTVHADLDLTHSSIQAIRCIVVETVDGDHTCRATADWSER